VYLKFLKKLITCPHLARLEFVGFKRDHPEIAERVQLDRGQKKRAPFSSEGRSGKMESLIFDFVGVAPH
jgi:hypothetical protein